MSDSKPLRPAFLSGIVTAYQWAVLAAIVLLLVIACLLGPEIIPFKDFSTDDVTRLITSAILVALFIERTTEVVLNAWRGTEKVRREQTLKTQKDRYTARFNEEVEASLQKLPESKRDDSRAKKEIEAVVTRKLQDSDEAKAVADATGSLDTYRSENRRLALLSGLIMGIAVSAIGLRLITPLLDGRVIDELPMRHHRFLITLDVFITGALLGGGANGLHKILDLFLKHVDNKRAELREKGKAADA